MLNINCPNRNSIEDIDDIVSEKYNPLKKVLQGLSPKIKNRYSDYSRIELSERILASIYTEDEKNAMQHLYSSKTATAKKIIEAISKSQLIIQAGCCVSCGIGDADQIDHFLPQQHFPEFSIMHKNLVPICGTCNEIKGDNISGVLKDYFHPMFDRLPTEPFLSCEISYEDNIPTSKFSILKRYNGSILAHHFKNLNLKERLEKKATQYFLQIEAYKNEFSDTFSLDEINRDILKLSVSHGTTFWKYLLCRKMIETDFVSKL